MKKMPTIEERESMSDRQLNNLLADQVSDVIMSAHPSRRLDLLALQHKIESMNNQAPSHFAAATELFKLMSVKFVELDKSLNGE